LIPTPSDRLSQIRNITAGVADVAARSAAYTEAVKTCPPIGQHLVDHLDVVFARPTYKPGLDNLSDHLIYQEGIDKVKKYLKDQVKAQEANARAQRTKAV